MDKCYMFISVTDNDLVGFTPLVAKYNVQLTCKIKDRTCYAGPKTLTL